jgi:two-component sensor histidine kinase
MEARIAKREQFRPTPRTIERPQLPKQIDQGPLRPAAAPNRTELIQENDVLLREMQHRVGNSLQIIASILVLHARQAQSDEARLHLENAHRRILAVATVQRFLYSAQAVERVELKTYLRHLCESLSASVVGESRVAIEVQADDDRVSPVAARNIGLIVTELVINALKHGFTADAAKGLIVVSYRVAGDGWRLSISDNGVGTPQGDQRPAHIGLGMAIVSALVTQLDAQLHVAADSRGRSVTVSHGVG